MIMAVGNQLSWRATIVSCLFVCLFGVWVLVAVMVFGTKMELATLKWTVLHLLSVAQGFA